MPPMTDVHRLFLQAFMSRGILNGKEVRSLYQSVCQQCGIEFDIQKLAEFTLHINSNIKPYHMEIKKGIDENDGTNFYCLINLQENDVSRMATHYNQSELEFFKKVIDDIVCSGGDGSMSSTEALNLVEGLQGKKMSKREAQDLIERLCTERWLTSLDGQLLLTPRAIMEFDLYIQDQFPDDAVKCELCRKLVVKGQNCAMCAVRMHAHCARKFIRAEDPKCPSCKQEWPHDITRHVKAKKDEKVVDGASEGARSGSGTSQASQPASQSTGNRRSSRR